MGGSRADSGLAAAILAAAGASVAIGWIASARDVDATIGPLPVSGSPVADAGRRLAPPTVDSSRQVAVEIDAGASPEPAPPPGLSPRLPARVAEIAAVLEADPFDLGAFSEEARVIASSCRNDDGAELRRLAESPHLSPGERIALAEILRHVDRTSEVIVPPAVLEDLRDAWRFRDARPVLAAAAVRALGAFGDGIDRRTLLEASASGPSVDLARLGLSAARGDEAALELLGVLREPTAPERLDAALSVLIAMANAGDSDLTQIARDRCADSLRGLALECAARGERSPRLLAALASLDPARAEEPLVLCLADPATPSPAAESAGSALAAIPSAADALDRIVRDTNLPLERRVVAAGARIAAGAEPSAEALAVLERARDEYGGTAIGRRAEHALAIARRASDPSAIRGADAGD